MVPDHFLSMVVYAVLVGLFFATLYHREQKPFLRSMGKSLGWMVLGSLAFAYLMHWTA